MIKSFPVVRFDAPAAPSERFKLWASQFGVARLGRSLGVDRRYIPRYASGQVTPKLLIARQIIALSAVEPLDGTPLTYEDLFGPACPSRVEVRTVTKSMAWE
jgi:hypothetical protein